MERRKFTNEFKTEAMRLALRGDIPKSAVARDLGIRPKLLYRWLSEFGPKADGSRGVSPDEHDELIRLRRKLRVVEEERDILKKAIGIFTKELP